MYTIIQLNSGAFRCIGQLQDGKEEWSAATLDEAVKSMKNFAKVMNGAKLKKKNIEYFKEKPLLLIPYKPFG